MCGVYLSEPLKAPKGLPEGEKRNFGGTSDYPFWFSFQTKGGGWEA